MKPENIDKTNLDSPALPGKPLSITQFKKWIRDAENAPSISLDEAKEDWASKRKLLEELTRINLVMQKRERYLTGQGKSYSWEEVKDLAINKKRPQ